MAIDIAIENKQRITTKDLVKILLEMERKNSESARDVNVQNFSEFAEAINDNNERRSKSATQVPTGSVANPFNMKLLNVDEIVKPFKKMFENLQESLAGIGTGSGMGFDPTDFIPDGKDGKGVGKGAGKAGKKGLLKGIGKGVMKFGAGALRAAGRLALPVAAGMAAFDAISGFNDEEMQQKAFNLKPGEKASFSQKMQAAFGTFLSGLMFDAIDAETMTKTVAGVHSKIDELNPDADAIDDPSVLNDNAIDIREKAKLATTMGLTGQENSQMLEEIKKQRIQENLQHEGDKANEMLDQEQMEEQNKLIEDMSDGIADLVAYFTGKDPRQAHNNNASGNTTTGQSGASGGMSGPYPAGLPGDLGSYIAKYESGNEGAMAVGYDRNGGTSYGKFQLSSKQGSMQEWLNMIANKDATGAEIAMRMSQAGALNTGSKYGAAVDTYKDLVSKYGAYIEQTQKEYTKKAHYDPAMAGLSPELQNMVKNDRGLQEMLWSTAVQHGGGGARSIFNKSFQSGMSRDQLIDAVYNRRSGNFGSSTGKVQESVRNRFISEANLIKGINADAGVQMSPAMAVYGGQPGANKLVNAVASTIGSGITRYSQDDRQAADAADCSSLMVRSLRNLGIDVPANATVETMSNWMAHNPQLFEWHSGLSGVQPGDILINNTGMGGSNHTAMATSGMGSDGVVSTLEARNSSKGVGAFTTRGMQYNGFFRIRPDAYNSLQDTGGNPMNIPNMANNDTGKLNPGVVGNMGESGGMTAMTTPGFSGGVDNSTMNMPIVNSTSDMSSSSTTVVNNFFGLGENMRNMLFVNPDGNLASR